LARSHTAGVQVQVLVVLDNCQDRTAVIAARFPGVRPVMISAGRVGAARHAGARAAIASAPPARELWLANTDADCAVPRDWLSFMVAEARCGTQVVLGTDLPGRAPSAGHLRITRTASIPVVTSSRTAARAPGGFASYLTALGEPQQGV